MMTFELVFRALDYLMLGFTIYIAFHFVKNTFLSGEKMVIAKKHYHAIAVSSATIIVFFIKTILSIIDIEALEPVIAIAGMVFFVLVFLTLWNQNVFFTKKGLVIVGELYPLADIVHISCSAETAIIKISSKRWLAQNRKNMKLDDGNITKLKEYMNEYGIKER